MSSIEKPYRLEYRDEDGRWQDTYFAMRAMALYARDNYRASGYQEVTLYLAGQPMEAPR